jgi:hypothetical protein
MYPLSIQEPKQEIKTEEQISTSMGYSERFSYEEWRSLINDLEPCKLFKLRVKSSPGDILKRVYVIEHQNEYDTDRYTNKVSFVMSDTKVIMDVMSNKNKLIDDFVACLMHDPIEKMPLYINDSRELIKIVANWRLKNEI